MAESTQHTLDRVRPPRVQITYDVEIGGAIQMKELPMVMGILADLAGQTAQPKTKERKFVQIDRDNFNDYLAFIGPKLKISVDNKLKNDGSKLVADLSFRTMDDFHPVQVLKQVPALRQLLETRTKLVDLLAKLDGNEELSERLKSLAVDESGLQAVHQLAAKSS
jgi:type VI secretion system protein ImpB